MPAPLLWLLHWPTQSQARSRRNALVANTALTALRHEREDVDRFLRNLTRSDLAPVTRTAARTAPQPADRAGRPADGPSGRLGA